MRILGTIPLFLLQKQRIVLRNREDKNRFDWLLKFYFQFLIVNYQKFSNRLEKKTFFPL